VSDGGTGAPPYQLEKCRTLNLKSFQKTVLYGKLE
jgi:hypothetical protein